ncbi:MAG TPA: molybdate ABC transporter substrate-binding protein [Xanthobacteraceae bacterium]|jgi:molybdate transport system substrate-binding protein|nr:molybdate ABC transporter substrate-binding protein [Xanthobacteraceae bacterium]
MRSYFVVAVTVLVMILASQARADSVRVMAAFTFKTALDDVVRVYNTEDGGDVVVQYGMTPMLARQVENQAPADIFISTDAMWMKYLQDHTLTREGSRVDLLTADLVLVTRSDNAAAPTNATVDRTYPLDKIIGAGRVAMCNPADDPAGRLGRASLEALGLWPSLADKVAIAENPPAAVTLVTRGEAPVALVFSTNIAGVLDVKVAGVFPKESHPPIVFPSAILRDSHNPAAAQFLTFLQSPKAMAIFETFGYRPASNAAR